MKISKPIAALIMILLFATSSVFAEVASFDLNKAIENAISRSASIKAQDHSYEDLRESNDDTGESAMNARDLLNINNRYIYLNEKKNRSLEEQLEWQSYNLAFGKPMTEEEKLPVLMQRDVSPAYMTLYLNSNRNTRALIANQIKLSIYEQYNAVMKIKESLDIQTRLVQNLEKNNSQAQLKLKQGKLSKLNARLIEINYQKSKLEIGKLQRSYDTQLINLNNMIGEPVKTKYSSFPTDNMAVVAAIKPYDEYLNKALKNRAEILNAEIGYKLKKMEYDLTKVAYPLESNLNNQDAKLSLDEAYNQLEAAKIDIEIEIANAYKELEKKLKAWESATAMFQSSEQSYKEALKKYSLNTITEKELSEANISLSQAEMQLKNSRRDLWMQQQKMDYASNLGPGIRNAMY